MWPAEHRGKGAGLMQCGLGIGFFCASGIWFFISAMGPSAWRWMYVIGVLPALATWWIRRGLVESDKWMESDRSEEHTSELQSPDHLVCRLLLEKKQLELAITALLRVTARRITI